MDKEKGIGRKSLDAAFVGVSIVTMPFAAFGAYEAYAAGHYLLGTGLAGYGVSDAVTIKEARSEKKSIINPSFWFDKFFGKEKVSGKMEAPQENFIFKFINGLKGSKRIEHSAQISAYPNRLALTA